MAQQLTNLAQSTLASSYTAGNTTITLKTGDGALFPSSGNFTVAVDEPPTFFLQCTARSGDTLTVSATGQEGTTAANRTTGTPITLVITNAVMRGLFQDYLLTDTLANLPSAGVAGRVFLPQNSVYSMIRDNGSTWDYFLNGRKVNVPETAFSFSWVNQGDATLTTTNGVAVLYGGSANGVDSRIRIKTAPATPYHIIIGYRARIDPTTNAMAGLCFRNSSSGKLSIYTSIFQGDPSRPVIFQLTNATSFSSTAYNPGSGTNDNTYGMSWMRIGDDGVNRKYDVSENGYTWRQLFSESNSSFFTADQVGYYVNGGNNNGEISVYTWEETA